MLNKNTFFLFTDVSNEGYLLKQVCFILTVTYNVGYFMKNTIYIIFDTYKCIKCLLILLQFKNNYINERTNV